MENNIQVTQNWRIPKGFPIGLKFVLMFENRIKTQTNKELENSKGFFHDKIVQLLRLGAAQANVQKAISGEITYEHRFRKIDRNSPHIHQFTRLKRERTQRG